MIFTENGRKGAGRESEGKKERDVDWLPPALTQRPGIEPAIQVKCPWLEIELGTFGSQTDALIAEPCFPGRYQIF